MAAAVLAITAMLFPSILGQLASQTCTMTKTATIQSQAEAMIGGILSLHFPGTNGVGCGAPVRSMHAFEAIRYVLDLVNKKNEILNGQYLYDYYVPGIRLGMKVVDYCGDEESAVAAVTTLFPALSSDSRSCSSLGTNLTLGIIGTSDSGSTAEVASYVDKYDLPVVSFASTAASLTLSGMYPDLLRTISPDGSLVQVIAQVLTRLNWVYVVVIYEDSEYGRDIYHQLRLVLSPAGICLTAAFMVDPYDTTPSTVQSLLNKVIATGTVGTIFLGSPPLATALLEQGGLVPGAGQLQWIFTDSIALETIFSISYPRGIISVLPSSRFIVEFEDHWVRIDEANPSAENPWFREWYMEINNCRFPDVSGSQRLCSSIYTNMSASDIESYKRLNFVQDQYVEPAVHAVFTYANALRQAQVDKCGQNFSGACPQLTAMSSREFLNNYLKKVSFTYAARERVPSLASDQYAPYFAAKKLAYDPRGDIINPSYAVWNYNDLQLGEGSPGFRFRTVGNFINGRLTLTSDNIRMYDMNRTRPVSPVPSSPCPMTGCSPCLGLPADTKYLFIHGDIVIHGVFSLHEAGTSKFTCSDIISRVNPLYLEALVYAINKVNQDRLILQGNVTLGALGIDDCMDSALSANFITQVQEGQLTVSDRRGNVLDPRKIEAYTAAYNAFLTIPLAEMMNIYKRPMIGYLASSAKLDDRSRYPYYAKAVPSINDELRAIVLILKQLKWMYVQVVYSVDGYSVEDVNLFKSIAAQEGICVVATHDLDVSGTNILQKLGSYKSVMQVVLLLSARRHHTFLGIHNSTDTNVTFNYIATTTLGNDMYLIDGYAQYAKGFISIDSAMSPLTSFFAWLEQRRIANYTVNPWFQEWYEAVYNCYVGSSNPHNYPSPCLDSTSPITAASSFVKELSVGHVINAVYAIARGLNAMLISACGPNYSTVCGNFTNSANKGMNLLNSILQVSFPVQDFTSQIFSFKDYSGRLPFTVYNFASDRFSVVGTVDPQSNTIMLNTGMITLYNDLNPSLVISQCTSQCLECLNMFSYLKYWYLDGDLIIPAIFDIHYEGVLTFSCGDFRYMNGMQYTEAFKFALDWINNGNASGVSLQGVKLGGIAFDGCTSDMRASAIINGVMGRIIPLKDVNGMMVDPTKFVSWLSYDSESTMEAAELLQMIDMPLVSPGATAPQLLDKTMYSTFFRTIPSDSVVARGMADLVQIMGWRYVITLNAPDAGSQAAQKLFRQYLEVMGICVMSEYEFETDGTSEIILQSINGSTTDVVAVFAEPDMYIQDLLKAKDQNRMTNIIFISNRWWDLKRLSFNGVTNVVSNTLAFRLSSPEVSQFLTYLSGLTLANSNNPWLPEYYQALFSCNLAGSTKYPTNCIDSSTTRTLGQSINFAQDIWTLSTINAVHSLAVALSQTLVEKCGANYTGVCNRFLTDGDTLNILMAKMDNETFYDIVNNFFDFIQREANGKYDIIRYDPNGVSSSVGTLSSSGQLSLTLTNLPTEYQGVRSDCTTDCLVCRPMMYNFHNFSYVPGDVYIVGLFDVHLPGATPYTCGTINDRQGLPLLEAFNYAVEYINLKQGMFKGLLKSVLLGAIGIDVCGSPTRAANLVANIQNGLLPITVGGFTINPRQILAYVGPFDTEASIRVADILNAINMPQVSYGATGLQLEDPDKYNYFLRSVPADDKQSRAIISYLKFFNFTNVQVVSTYETIGQAMTKEFMRLAILNLVCINHNYTIGESGIISPAESIDVVNKISQVKESKVVVLLVDDPLPILVAAGDNNLVKDDVLWIATTRWGYNPEYLNGQLNKLLGNRYSKKNVIIFDVETADVPGFDAYLEAKTPDNYFVDPWYQEYYEFLFNCSWTGTSAKMCDSTRGLSRADNYDQDAYVLYVVNAVFAVGLGIEDALYTICVTDQQRFTNVTTYNGLCPAFQLSGDRRDKVLNGLKKVNFTDDTMQPFYFYPTGQSSRGFHIFNVTCDPDITATCAYMFDNVGSYNDTYFLKLDITYDVEYEALCIPFVNCTCKFPRYIPTRYMLNQPLSDLNLVYIGDIHQRNLQDPFACSSINAGSDFLKMMAFFYAINSVNTNTDLRYPESLRLGGIALDTCSSQLRLDQDIFNLLSGFPLCDTAATRQVIPPSTIMAVLPDGDVNAISVTKILSPTGITSLSPTSTYSALHDTNFYSNFLSVVPSIKLQAYVIMQLFSAMKWDYTSIVYSIEPFSIAAKEEFLSQTFSSALMCTGQALGLSLTATLADAEEVLVKVGQQVGARAVILFTLPAHTRLLLEASKELGQSGRFVWIGTSYWDASVVNGFENQAAGAIIVQPHFAWVEDFRSWIKTLTFNNRHGIPDDWFEEFYQTVHKCVITKAKRPLAFSQLCTMQELITDDMVPLNPSILHTIIAVYMVAQGLNNIQSCRSTQYDIFACITTLQNRNQQIYQAILSAQWSVLPSLLANQSFSFAFTTSGYGNIGYDILNYHAAYDGSGYVYSMLGRYQEQLIISSPYRGMNLYDGSATPNSYCAGARCLCVGPSTRRSSMAAGTVLYYNKSSVWYYTPMKASLMVTEEGRTYQDPETGQLYYVAKIPGVTSRYSDMWGVAVITLAAIGVFVSLSLFLYLLVIYPNRGGTTIVGFVLSFGIILLYGLVFAFVAHASEELCGLRRFCLGFCYAICYTALFVKLVDAWRARDKADMNDVKYSKMGRPFGLFIIVVLLVLVQVIINAEWLILVPPRVVRIFYYEQYWPRCTPNDFYDQGLVLSLVYNMVLILLIIILGFCSFNSTKNHRESRWILGIGVLSVPTWVVWCAWSILGAIRTRDAAVAVGLLVNATILLLLGPVRKLYLVNKYQALIEEEEKEKEKEALTYRGDLSSVYGRQYDNQPELLHDGASGHGGTMKGSVYNGYRYPPSSVGRSGYSYNR